jgi:hypothetical protein
MQETLRRWMSQVSRLGRDTVKGLQEEKRADSYGKEELEERQ